MLRLLERHWWILVVLGVLGLSLGIYAAFEKGRADARYDREHGISRF